MKKRLITFLIFGFTFALSFTFIVYAFNHDKHVIIVVPDALKAAANTAATAWDPDTGGGNTFTIPSNASGCYTDTFTHWHCQTYASTAMWTEMKTLTNDNSTIKMYDVGAFTLETALADQSLLLINSCFP